MITVIVNGVQVLAFKAFVGWGAFVIAFLSGHATQPQPTQPTGPRCYNGACLPGYVPGGVLQPWEQHS